MFRCRTNIYIGHFLKPPHLTITREVTCNKLSGCILFGVDVSTFEVAQYLHDEAEDKIHVKH